MGLQLLHVVGYIMLYITPMVFFRPSYKCEKDDNGSVKVTAVPVYIYIYTIYQFSQGMLCCITMIINQETSLENHLLVTFSPW